MTLVPPLTLLAIWMSYFGDEAPSPSPLSAGSETSGPEMELSDDPLVTARMCGARCTEVNDWLAT